MTNFIGSAAGKLRDKGATVPASSLRIQSSVNGTPRPFGYGQARVAGNLLWDEGIIPDFVPNSTASGKNSGSGGGGKSGAGSGTFIYYTGFIDGLCEGPINSVVQGWENKNSFPISTDSNLGPAFSVFNGAYTQLPWTYLQTNYPQVAQNFRGIAYVADSSLFLGTNSELPNFSFDIRFQICNALVEFDTVPASSAYNITAMYFNWDYGVSTHVFVPYSSPYQIVPDLNPTTRNGLAESINNSTLGSGWYLSNSSNVLYDNGATNGTYGQPFVRVGSSPTQGQYSVVAAATPILTFAAADAGQPIIIIAAALSPGVYYTETITGTTTAGSITVANVLPNTASLAPGQSIISNANIPPGTFIMNVHSGTANGNTTSGTPSVGNLFGNFTIMNGMSVTDSGGAIPSATTVNAFTYPLITAGALAGFTAEDVTFALAFTTTAVLDGTAQLTSVASFAGVGLPATVSSPALPPQDQNIPVISFDSGAGTIQLAYNPSVLSDGAVPITVVTQITGSTVGGSATISNPFESCICVDVRARLRIISVRFHRIR